ncbi:hypothetical protein BAE46_05505 [Glaciecola punicea]|uniref:hypothetical protein n=1 Tax=Glaciecola punicea TaxID=56804 RepID=UPI0008729E1D|nr:hypothetical protein [Glaciecola punicea]OFA32470.1 hypothetical protein BAE46_05505 [Glaciecola punicea]
MLAIKWGLVTVLSFVFFFIGGVIIELVFVGLVKVAELAGSPSDGPPSYLMIVVKRVFGFLFGSSLAVYTVIRLVRDLNQSLYLKFFGVVIITFQASIVLYSIVMIGFSGALILVIIPIFECLGALAGASYGFALALTKEKGPEVSSDL